MPKLRVLETRSLGREGAGPPRVRRAFCHAPIEMGLDGETKVIDSPLRFSIRPSPVRVRLLKQAIGYWPAARSLGWRKSLRLLWALGRTPA